MAKPGKNRKRGSQSLDERLQKLPPVTRANIERALAQLAQGTTHPRLSAKATAELRRAVSSGLGDLRFRQLVLYAESLTAQYASDPAARIVDFVSEPELTEQQSLAEPPASAVANATQNSTLPPRTAEFLLFLLLDGKDRETVIGDLAEEYNGDLLPRFGKMRARLWYWTQVFRTIGPMIFKRVRSWGKWAVVADLVHRAISRLS